MDDRSKTNIIINIHKAREGGGKSREEGDLDSVMIVTTPPSKRARSRKRKREVEEASSVGFNFIRFPQSSVY